MCSGNEPVCARAAQASEVSGDAAPRGARGRRAVFFPAIVSIYWTSSAAASMIRWSLSQSGRRITGLFRLQHLPTQLWLGLEGDVLGHATFLTPLGMTLLFHPFLRQIQTAVQQGVPCAAGITQEYACDAVRNLAQFTTPLTFHTHRFIPLFGELAAIQAVDPLRVSQVLIHLLPMALQNGFVFPSPLADKVLHGTNGIGIGACQSQDQGLETGLLG